MFAGCYKFDGEGAKTLRNYRKGNLHVLELDVTDDVSVQKAVSTVEEQVSKKGRPIVMGFLRDSLIS